MNNPNAAEWEARREIGLAIWRAKQPPNPIKVLPAYSDIKFLDKCPNCGSRGRGRYRPRLGKESSLCNFCGQYYRPEKKGYEIVEEPRPKAMFGYVKLRPSMR